MFTSPQPFDLLPFAKKEKFQCLVQKIIMARLFPKQLSWFTSKRMKCFLYRVHFFCPCPFIPVFFIPICSTVFFLHPYGPSFSFPIYERWVYCFIPEKNKTDFSEIQILRTMNQKRSHKAPFIYFLTVGVIMKKNLI